MQTNAIAYQTAMHRLLVIVSGTANPKIQYWCEVVFDASLSGLLVMLTVGNLVLHPSFIDRNQVTMMFRFF
jgi:hypothetical protein